MKICQVNVDIWIISDVFTLVYLALKELWRHLLEDMMTSTIYFVQQGQRPHHKYKRIINKQTICAAVLCNTMKIQTSKQNRDYIR